MASSPEPLATSDGPPSSLLHMAALRMADLIGNGRVPPIDGPLPAHFSNMIVDAMKELNILDETSLENLAQHELNITRIDLSGCGEFSYLALTHLAKYVLESINIASSGPKDSHRFDLTIFIRQCLNEKTLSSLKHLNISGDQKRLAGIKSLSVFTAMESLSVSSRPFCHRSLEGLVRSLPHLRMLDISNTLVSDITSLEYLTNLNVLVMHNLKIKSGDASKTLQSLEKLQALDISKKVTDYNSDSSAETCVDLPLSVLQVVQDGGSWPHLKTIDLAGNSLAGMGIDHAVNIVDALVKSNPNLSRISLLATPLDGHSYMCPVENRSVTVINCATRADAIFALSEYWNTDREALTCHALHAVYYLLQSGYDDFSRQEVSTSLKLVCSAMHKHRYNMQVQMAGSACLYHMCKSKRMRRLSIGELMICMDRCLDTAEQYRTQLQLQKNVWLTLCNDYLLQLPGLDFSRTCKVALESMLANRDSSVSRMTIAIVSIVTPKLRALDAQALTQDVRYVRHLVQLMGSHLYQYPLAYEGPGLENCLFTLKFTLSGIWNLTDESTETCLEFFKLDGIRLAFNILRVFKDHSNIQTKVLGILNNVAEVHELKMYIMSKKEYLNQLIDCLRGDFHAETDDSQRNRVVERSYFAAGVLANILQCEEWQHSETYRERVDQAMASSIRMWPALGSAMVSYRSFDPFVRILKKTRLSGSQMWCLWGVNHVLSHRDKNPSFLNYIDKLNHCELPQLCAQLALDPSVDPLVRQLAEQIESVWMSDSQGGSLALERVEHQMEQEQEVRTTEV